MHFTNTIVVIDTETTGLDATRCAVIEIGAVAVNGRTLAEISRFQTLVHPFPGHLWTAEAEQVHGHSWESLYEARPEYHALSDLLDWLDRLGRYTQFAGWNVAFDMAFLEAAIRRCDLLDLWRKRDFHALDIWTMYQTAYLLNVVPVNLRSLNSYCDWKSRLRGKQHSALEDAEITAEALRTLMETAKP